MRIGVPKEIKNHEYRVGLTPASVAELVAAGHEVFVETKAGSGIDCPDTAFKKAGATILPTAAEVFKAADMIVKVKEPQAQEIALLEPRHILFTYLHLAADKPQAEGLMKSGATCIAYETVTSRTGALPLLKPMSEVAGRMSVQVGAHYLEKEQGGRGVLLGGVPGVAPAKVAILGGGVAGVNAAQMAVGMRADVTIYDINNERLAELDMFFGARSRPPMRRARDRQRGREGRAGDRRGAGSRRRRAQARHPRHAQDDEARQRAGRHRHRPGRLLRNQPCDHPRRPGLRGRRDHPLLRRQHARRGRADQRLRAQQRDPALRAARSPTWAPKKRCRPTRTSPTGSMSRAARSATRRSPKRSTCRSSRA